MPRPWVRLIINGKWRAGVEIHGPGIARELPHSRTWATAASSHSTNDCGAKRGSQVRSESARDAGLEVNLRLPGKQHFTSLPGSEGLVGRSEEAGRGHTSASPPPAYTLDTRMHCLAQ